MRSFQQNSRLSWHSFSRWAKDFRSCCSEIPCSFISSLWVWTDEDYHTMWRGNIFCWRKCSVKQRIQRSNCAGRRWEWKGISIYKRRRSDQGIYFEKTEGKTKPPARFTEGTLLKAMENPVKYMQQKDAKAAKTVTGKPVDLERLQQGQILLISCLAAILLKRRRMKYLLQVKQNSCCLLCRKI